MRVFVPLFIGLVVASQAASAATLGITSPSSLPSGAVGVVYASITFTATGGTGAYTWSETGLPGGLGITTGGVLGGTPAVGTQNTYTVTVTVTDSLGIKASEHYQLFIQGTPALVITGPVSTLPAATVGVAYTGATFTATGGTGGYTWSVTGLGASSGLTLSAGGSLSGNPVPGSQGPYTLTVTVTDSINDQTSGTFQLAINAPGPVLTITSPTSPLTTAPIGVSYPAESFTASGGTAPYAWQQTGLPPSTGLSLSSAGVLSGTPVVGSQGQYNMTVIVADSNHNQASGQFQISLTTSAIFASPQVVNFTYQQGGFAVPTQTFSLFSKAAALQYSLKSSVSWLVATAATGQTPDTDTISLQNLSGIPQCPGPSSCSQTATITITPVNGSTPIYVAVNLTVIPIQPVLSVSPQYLNVSAVAGAAPLQRHLQVSNNGGQTINYTVTGASVPWLSVSCNGTGSVTLSNPMTVCLGIDPSTLDAGVYHVPLVVSGGAGTPALTVNVTLRLAQAEPLILLSPGALEFSALRGGQSPAPQTFEVFNIGAGLLDWSATVTAPWLKLSTSPGCASISQTVTGSSTYGGPAGSLTACVTSSLAPLAQNYAQITVTSPAGPAGNSAAITVFLNVLPSGSGFPDRVAPTAVTLRATAGSSTLVSAPVNCTDLNNGIVNFATDAVTEQGTGWLSTDQNSYYLPGGSTTTLQVRANAASLTPGIYHGQVRIGFTDSTTSVVNVILEVSAASDTASVRESARGHRQHAMASPPNCPNGTLLPPQILNLTQQGFLVQGGGVQQLLVQVKDSCGNAITDADAGASVSLIIYNSDTLVTLESPPIAYSSVQGAWQFAWTPATAEVGPVGIYAVAGVGFGESSVGSRSDVWSGAVAVDQPGAAPEPLVAINAASPNVDGVFQANQVAAGSYIAIYGDLFADGVDKPYPFPILDEGNTVLLGGVPLLLEYVSATQVNALVPTAGLPLNAPLPLTVERDGAFSLADMQVSVAAVQPAIFILDQFSQGAVLIANTTDVAAQNGYLPGSRPAKAGVDYIEIYCNGLGPVDNPPPDGQPAGTNPVPMSVTNPTVSVGGVNAPVVFSGLSPGSIALYQVNVQVPAGSLKGNGVKVVVTVGEVASNTVLISVD